jgi:hypothetical protein
MIGPSETQGTVSSSYDMTGNLGQADTFNWDGDISALVDSGFIDASQLWLWADSLDFESFGQGSLLQHLDGARNGFKVKK